MKQILTIVLLFGFSIFGFSQNSKYEYAGRLNPSIKKEKLTNVKFVTDLSPVLWHLMVLPYQERVELDNRRKANYPLGFYVYPEGGYNIIIDYVSVEIFVSRNGEIFTAKSTSDELTAEQKNIINTADLGADINIKVKFMYKNDKKLTNGNIIDGNIAVTIVPEIEAEFPGGNKGITNYLMEHLIHKISIKESAAKLGQAIVKFTIDEKGQIGNVELFQLSPTTKTDELLLDAVSKMPKWAPAKDSKGTKIKQEFTLSFGGNTGC